MVVKSSWAVGYGITAPSPPKCIDYESIFSHGQYTSAIIANAELWSQKARAVGHAFEEAYEAWATLKSEDRPRLDDLDRLE